MTKSPSFLRGRQTRGRADIGPADRADTADTALDTANTVRSIPHMFSRLGLLLAAGLLASACATTRAAAPVERPALEVPPVPPRIVEAGACAGSRAASNRSPICRRRSRSRRRAKPRPSSPRDTAIARPRRRKPSRRNPCRRRRAAAQRRRRRPRRRRRSGRPPTADAAASERQIRDTHAERPEGL